MTRTNRYLERNLLTDEEQTFHASVGECFLDCMGAEDMEYYLKHLTANQRCVIVERFWNQHSVESTAKRLGISENAVKNRTRDAVNKLRKVLKEEL